MPNIVVSHSEMNGSGGDQQLTKAFVTEPVSEPSHPTPRGPIHQTVIKALKEHSWKFYIDEDNANVRATVQGKHSSYNMCFHSLEDKQRLLVFAMCAPKVPEAVRGEAAQFFCRANFGIELGSFEFDLRDGEIRYKTAIDVEGGELTTAMVISMLNAAASTVDRYFPGIMRMCYGTMTADMAVQSVESGMVNVTIQE